MGAKVPGLQRDMAQTDETEDSAGEREKAEGQGPQSDDGKPEPVSESDDRCTDTGAVRMDKLLQTDGSQGEYWRSWTAGSNGNCVAWCGGS
nr:hypothetical protein [Citrobacter freundii]